MKKLKRNQKYQEQRWSAVGELEDKKSQDVDLEMIKLLGRLTPGQRVRNMLEAQKFAMSIIRGRVRRRFPDLSQREINIKVFEEIYQHD